MVADGHEAGGQQTDAALRAGKEILQHFVIGTAGFLRHLAVAHGCHDHTVLYGHAVDLDGGEELIVGIQLLCHAAGTAGFVFVPFLLEPVAVGVYKLLNQGVVIQGKFLAFCMELCKSEYIV